MSRTTDFIRLAGHYGAPLEVIVCEGNFHGRTLAATSFSKTPEYKKGFDSFTLGFTIVPYGDLQTLENANTRIWRPFSSNRFRAKQALSCRSIRAQRALN
ncbi:hypothetical protein YDYSG_25210 [Paenibacillus tyrfis]|nr:hypothetical protein YDYSG_25210 [Paenibacillus tyrfis]